MKFWMSVPPWFASHRQNLNQQMLKQLRAAANVGAARTRFDASEPVPVPSEPALFNQGGSLMANVNQNDGIVAHATPAEEALLWRQ